MQIFLILAQIYSLSKFWQFEVGGVSKSFPSLEFVEAALLSFAFFTVVETFL